MHPHPAVRHADAEQRAQHEERREGGREAGQRRHDRVEDDVDHHRQPSTVPVRHDTKEQGAERTHRQRQRQGERDVRTRLAERLHNVGDEKVRTKKSNASNVHPRKLASTALRC
jgi:hypothetical protein